MKTFLKTTILGGVLFLLPVAVILILLGHALGLATKAATPISHYLGLDRFGEWSGIGAVTLIAVVVLVFVSFMAGILARTERGRRASRWFENSVFGNLPQYQLFKNMGEGLAQVEGASGAKPVLVSIDDGWQIGYLLEPLEQGWVVVFLPQAPTPMSGNVMYFPSDRIRPLDITMVQAMAVVKRIGVGSSQLLRGADLKP